MFGCWDVSTHLSTGGDSSLGFTPQQAAERGSHPAIPVHPSLWHWPCLWTEDFVINDTSQAASVEIFICKFGHIKGVLLFWHPCIS